MQCLFIFLLLLVSSVFSRDIILPTKGFVFSSRSEISSLSIIFHMNLACSVAKIYARNILNSLFLEKLAKMKNRNSYLEVLVQGNKVLHSSHYFCTALPKLYKFSMAFASCLEGQGYFGGRVNSVGRAISGDRVIVQFQYSISGVRLSWGVGLSREQGYLGEYGYLGGQGYLGGSGYLGGQGLSWEQGYLGEQV